MRDRRRARNLVRRVACACTIAVLLAPGVGCVVLGTAPARAAVGSSAVPGVPRSEPQAGGTSLESAATKAGNVGRAVAMSLIGLAFAVAGTVLAFRRDFKEAAAVFAVGIIAVLLATQAGVNLLKDTVASLFGSR
jgi:lysylphosphatidylglycerol synthetase-like protein (DUF2156 family)